MSLVLYLTDDHFLCVQDSQSECHSTIDNIDRENSEVALLSLVFFVIRLTCSRAEWQIS